MKEFSHSVYGVPRVMTDLFAFAVCVSARMKLLLVAAAALAVASCASISLEDLEFHAWKLKFGETVEIDV